ncbi:MAG: helix-turn-helix domain-containing protein [Catenibacterium sp.]|uniref:helix-turn-helix domain-containing protein n=1 Tax=Catenibacterium sp. TaxID=2049022 RepID=UPI003992BF9E
MQENRKQKNKYVIIYDDFREQGLTLVKAYIVGRVSRFNNVGSPYYESNKTLSKAMGISESTVKRAIDELVKEGILYRKSLPRKRLLSTKPFNNEVHGEPLVEGHTEPLVEGHGEPHENNNVVGQTPKGFMVNHKGVHGEPHERVMVNHYKIEDKIEDKIEENPNPKNRSTNLNDLPLDKQVELLEEALENMNYRHNEDFY